MNGARADLDYGRFAALVAVSMTLTTVLSALALLAIASLYGICVNRGEGTLPDPAELSPGTLVGGVLFFLFWLLFFGFRIALVASAISLTAGYALWVVGVRSGLPFRVLIIVQVAVAAAGLPAAALYYDMPEVVSPGQASLFLIVLCVGLIVGIPVWSRVGRRLYASAD